jgi:2-polyprenyl-3-methyl-5-hydroxy-6-metoxy-1,4-benzoquinol methylase
VTATSRVFLRERLYSAYASQHADTGGGEAAVLNYRRDIRPALPTPSVGSILDIGCGQGDLVRVMCADGYDAEGIDISPEQVAIAHAAGVDQVREGDYRCALAERAGLLAAVVATDLLEHLAKDEVLDTFDRILEALAPGGVFVARVPNAASPFGGSIRYGDFTHETWYTERSVRQLSAAAGFASIGASPCAPIAHGLMSTLRVAVWKAASGFCKLALAAETGRLRGHIVTQNLTFVARKEH